MPHVIHRTVILTLEVVAAGGQQGTAAHVAAVITGAWLQAMDACMATHPSSPTCQITMRQLPPEQGAQIEIILCWFVLQAHRQEISDFERVR